MYIIFGAMAGTDWQAITPLLESMGCSSVPEKETEQWLLPNAKEDELPTPSDGGVPLLAVGERIFDMNLPELLSSSHDIQVLLVYDRPEVSVAKAVGEGEGPTESLKKWQNQVEAILNAYRSERRKVHLVSAEQIAQNPVSFADAIKKHIGLDGSNRLPPCEYQLDKSLEIYQLVGHQMVLQTDRARKLAEEFEASSIPLGERFDSPVFDCERIFRSVKPGVIAEDSLTDLENENELLLIQLHQVQEELESYYLENQEEAIRSQKLEDLLKEKERELWQYIRTLHQLRQSRSWRITKPLRVMTKLLTRTRNNGKAA